MLEEQMRSNDLSVEEKVRYQEILALYGDIKFVAQWHKLTESEKQARRIKLLAQSRNSNMLNTIPRIIKCINIYAKITEVEPYIMGMNDQNQFDELLALCAEEKELIDMELYSNKNHVSQEKVQSVFEKFLQMDKSMEERLHPESIQKIIELRKAFEMLE